MIKTALRNMAREAATLACAAFVFGAITLLGALHSSPPLRAQMGMFIGFADSTNVLPAAHGNDGRVGLYFATGKMGISGHIESGIYSGVVPANVPVPSACGTTPALAAGSTDTLGTITMGSTATGCVLTFGTAYALPPVCTVTWRATPLASQSYTTSAAALTLTQTSTSNNLADYVCMGRTAGG